MPHNMNSCIGVALAAWRRNCHPPREGQEWSVSSKLPPFDRQLTGIAQDVNLDFVQWTTVMGNVVCQL